MDKRTSSGRANKKKKNIKWPGPKIGSRRTIKRFAWFPQLLDNGNYVWLEKYLSHEEFCRDFKGTKWKVWKKEPLPPYHPGSGS